MVTKIELKFELEQLGRCVFRCVSLSDISQLYIDSLNAETKFLETTPAVVTIQSQQNYVATISKSDHQAIAGLFMGNGDLVATSGMQDIYSVEASIGIFVFNGYRGKKLGKVLVWSACTLLAHWTGIKKFSAGMNAVNEASIKSFTGCGFAQKIVSSNECSVRANELELCKPSLMYDCRIG